MNRIIRQSRPALLAACAALGLSFAATAPARAIEDDGRGNMLDAMQHLFGLGDKDQGPDIQYRERSPLVLPPKMDLPAPGNASAQRAANWPQDQELVRARAKAAEKGHRITDSDQIMTARELKQQGRYAAGPVNEKPGPRQGCSMDPFDKSGGNGGCDPGTYWKNLDQKKVENPNQLQAGVEPKREYLTQPPKGYLAPTNNVKATFEPTKKDIDADPRDYYWDQARKQSER